MSLYPKTLPATLAAFPDGIDGIRETLRTMVRLTKQGRKDIGIVQLARAIVQPLPAKDYRAEITRVFHWVKQHIRYVHDPRDVETIATPAATLTMQSGDCDDMSVLLAALLEALGHPTRFLALGFDNDPYSHVIVQTKIGESAWLSLDPSVASSTVGWSPPNATRAMPAHV